MIRLRELMQNINPRDDMTKVKDATSMSVKAQRQKLNSFQKILVVGSVFALRLVPYLTQFVIVCLITRL